MKHLRSFNEGMTEDRVDIFIKIAKAKYADKTAEQIIEIINSGNEMSKFNSKKEERLFKSKWDNR